MHSGRFTRPLAASHLVDGVAAAGDLLEIGVGDEVHLQPAPQIVVTVDHDHAVADLLVDDHGVRVRAPAGLDDVAAHGAVDTDPGRTVADDRDIRSRHPPAPAVASRDRGHIARSRRHHVLLDPRLADVAARTGKLVVVTAQGQHVVVGGPDNLLVPASLAETAPPLLVGVGAAVQLSTGLGDRAHGRGIRRSNGGRRVRGRGIVRGRTAGQDEDECSNSQDSGSH